MQALETHAFTSGLAGIDRRLSSPNHGPRAPGCEHPDSIVLHYTGMADEASAVAWLCNPVSQVSCHYVVAEDGRILQLVAEERRAWHAGRSDWQGMTDVNSVSLGIEIVNRGHEAGLPPYPDQQIDAVITLCRDLMARHGIAPDRVLAHSDIAPDRKRDPGERFPWRRLAAAGVAIWPDPDPRLRMPEADGVSQAQALLRDIGYGLDQTGVADVRTASVLRAFQRRFRPERVDGHLDDQTWSLLHAVAELNGQTAA